MIIKLKYTLPNLWPASTEMNLVWSWVYKQVKRSSMNQASDPKFSRHLAFCMYRYQYIYRAISPNWKRGGGAKLTKQFKGLRALLYRCHCIYTCIKKNTYIYCTHVCTSKWINWMWKLLLRKSVFSNLHMHVFV